MAGARGIQVGICTDQNLPWPTLVERWQYFERLGFASAWDCDHFNQPSRPTGPFYEGWTTLAALAARTASIRVGVLVSCNSFRHPALLAHQAMTVDHVSGGRLELGIGAGWFVPEHEQFGLGFPPAHELVGRFHEAVRIVDMLLRDGTATFTGKHYRLRDAHLRPATLQKPRPPLTLGAHGPRMLRICAEYADRWNSFGTVAEMRERNLILDEQCAAVGRAPGAIIRSFYGWASKMAEQGLPDPWASVGAFEDVVGRYAEVGIGEFIMDQPEPAQFPVLEKVASDVIPKLRERGPTMRPWHTDPRLSRLVAERRGGSLSRRAFLGALGGAAAATAVPSGPARGQKKVTVTMWDTEPNPATRAAVKQIVDDFHKAHKDIEVRAEGMGWGDMDRKLQAAMAAKSPPTASHTQTYVVTSFRAKGLIEPVDDVVKAIGEDKIFPSVLRWLKYPDGKYWGITHAWGAEMLGGRGDLLAGTGVNPQSWKTWDDWARDIPKLTKAPQHYGLDLAGIPFFVNEDVYMWVGSNGGSLFDDKGNPALESPQVLGMLEFWKKLKPSLPPGWASHDYLETLSAWATGKTAQVMMWGRTAGYIDQYAPPDKRNPDVFQIWPKSIGPMGKAPLTQFDNEPWVIYSGAPADEKAACKEFLKFFFKPENYRKYCDSVPVHILSIFKADFQDATYMGHPERKRWKPWLDAQLKWVEMGRAHPLLVCNPQDMLVPWIGDVAAAPILADMVMAVVEKGKEPRAAAKEASDKIQRDIIAKSK